AVLSRSARPPSPTLPRKGGGSALDSLCSCPLPCAMTRATTALARRLRRNPPPAERRLWAQIRREQVAGFKFRRQVALDGFIVDSSEERRVGVHEVDGATHSTDAELASDATRAAHLRALCYAMLSLATAEVYHN